MRVFGGSGARRQLEAALAHPVIALAADSERVAAITASEVVVLSAKDLSHLLTVPGNFSGVKLARLRPGKLILWPPSMLSDARPSTTLLDLTAPKRAEGASRRK